MGSLEFGAWLRFLLDRAPRRVSMTLPMVAWMRIRGHGWRHGFEMAAGMLMPWAAVLGASWALPWLSSAADAAMLLGMLGVMLVRRDHYGAHGEAHHHAAESRPAGRIPRRRLSLGLGRPSSLDFVPHYSFAEYDAQVGRPPDLIAIPYFEADPTSERDAVVYDWIRGHFGPNTTILGICSGTTVLADTGLLAGRTATSNTGTFDYVESHSPTTTWLRNLRYVDDGNIITSTNLTGGIDATLHVVDHFAGRATALDVARQIGYTQTGALDDPRFDPQNDSDNLLAIGGNAALDGPRQQLDVLVYDGVTELGLSGLVDPYMATARPFVMAPERRIVPSRDGFLFLPRYDISTVTALDRVLVPAGENAAAKQQVIAAWSAVHPTQPAEDLYRNVGLGESAYAVTVRDLARTRNGILANAVANVMFYPTTPQDFSNAVWPVSKALALVALGLLGAAAVFGATRLRVGLPARLGLAEQF
jgi:AraC family transcriptional regulator, transcriptional activator FtrA